MHEDGSPKDGLVDDQNPLLRKLQSLWPTRDTEKLREEIRLAFAALEDPLAWALDALESQDWKGKGHCLAYYIVHELQLWIKEHPTVPLPAMSVRQLHPRVLPLLSRCHSNLLDPLIGIYQLRAADVHTLLGHVEELHHKNMFKEAITLSIKLNLQPNLEVEKMCVPLLLQDKVNLVESYVGDYPELQQQLLRMLDSWFEPGFKIKDLTRRYRGLPNIRPEKVSQKTLSKLIFRFLEKYSLDPALCPNAINQRHLGTLKYLLYKRFVEKTMTDENWADHIQHTVQDNRWLQEQLVQLLVRYCGLQTAATWALRYGLPADSLPYHVANEMKALGLQDREKPLKQRASDGESKQRGCYYQLPIPREDVLFVGTWEGVLKCREAVLQPGQIVGIDMEWRPSFGAVEKNSSVSLVQVAVRDRVFLLDILQLRKQEGQKEEEALSTFFQELFADPAILKLGYGMSGDLHSLVETSVAFRDVNQQLCGVLDLLTVHQQFPKCSGEVRRIGQHADPLWPEDKAQGGRLPEKGLSQMVQQVLGKPLDKTEQLSNWERRPLREKQVLYAASDAYCLLDVYAKLTKDPAAFELSADMGLLPPKTRSAGAQAKELPSQQGVPPTPKEKSAPRAEGSPSPSAAVSPRDFRVVCDNMLQGLGRYLRCLGVDVRVLENDDEHRKAAEIARQERRVILTSGLPYQTLRSQVGEGRCFLVNSSEKAKEQAVQVLRHFNVRVTLADIFSRCQACNCDRYLKISKEKMVQLMKQRGFLSEEDAAGESSGDPGTTAEAEPLEPGSQRPTFTPDCPWTEEPSPEAEPALLPSGTPLKIEAVPVAVLSKEDLTDFYCCGQCGKVFWEGSHFGRVVSQFQEVLDLSGEQQSFYELV